MSHVYSDPSRVDDHHALPNMEVFFVDTWPDYGDVDEKFAKQWPELTSGWYYWACFPGCRPDGDPVGPYKTEDEAKVACLDINEYR